MKKIYIFSILLFVLGLTGCQKINIGDVSANQETIQDQGTEVGDVDEIEENNSQSTDIGKIESQEDIDLGEDGINIDDIDSIGEITEYMISEQSFDITLDDWGEVTFVSCEPQKPFYCDYEASFFLIRDEQILYQFPYMNEHNKRDYTGCFDSIGAVAFRDINGDAKKDVIIVFYYYTGMGENGMILRPKSRIFLAGENEFYLAEDMMADVEQHINDNDMTIENICNFLKDNN